MANTAQRSVRIDDELWHVFGAYCDAHGISRAARLIEHMKADVETLDVEIEGSDNE